MLQIQPFYKLAGLTVFEGLNAAKLTFRTLLKFDLKALDTVPRHKLTKLNTRKILGMGCQLSLAEKADHIQRRQQRVAQGS